MLTFNAIVQQIAILIGNRHRLGLDIYQQRCFFLIVWTGMMFQP